MTFDPLNILLLAVALIVFWRLKSVLGTRTGTEKPPMDPFEPKRSQGSPVSDAQGTVVRLPSQLPQAPQPESEAAEPIWTGYADEGSQLARQLEDLRAADPSFSPRSFVEGAKAAYEMIVEAFAKGDKAQLKSLLSKDVLDEFSRAIDERQAAGQRVEFRFVGIDKAAIQSAALVGRKATVTMRFVSELVTATYGRNGEIVDGDPSSVREVSDVWTFERDVSSRDPNWKLVATQAPA
jgi:predicted lipid-binding transport protein (Tim44 family)